MLSRHETANGDKNVTASPIGEIIVPNAAKALLITKGRISTRHTWRRDMTVCAVRDVYTLSEMFERE